MNVFEDFVIELKNEKYLEDTVIENSDRALARSGSDDQVGESSEPTVQGEAAFVGTVARSSGQTNPAARGSYGLTNVELPVAKSPEPAAADSVDLRLQGNPEVIEIRKPSSEHEFFKKRSVSEISTLQMVEAVLSSVERERMKIVPRSFDALEAKKALHYFLQVVDNTDAGDHNAAESALLRETETWCSALAERDKDISVANIRMYCENCKPMLSSQAMLAMARYYRNLPYSESVRGKFDFIITRLFSRPVDVEKRMLLFTRDEMLGHIKTLYEDWSSVPLYTANDDESNILLTALSFEDLTHEAESATGFDDLIRSDFFSRLRLFKESIAEIFFAPTVTAAAIDCNIRIGNVYVDLIDREHRKSDIATIHEKFGDLDDLIVSSAAGRTLEFADILRERSKPSVDDADVTNEPEARADTARDSAPPTNSKTKSKSINETSFLGRMREQALAVNRYFLAASIVIILASIGIFVWGNYLADPNVSTAGVKTLSFQGTEFGAIIKTARLSGDTLYVVAQPTLDSMPRDQQIDLLQKLYQAGNDKGWVKVNLMNGHGKTVGFASASRTEMVSQRQ